MTPDQRPGNPGFQPEEARLKDVFSQSFVLEQAAQEKVSAWRQKFQETSKDPEYHAGVRKALQESLPFFSDLSSVIAGVKESAYDEVVLRDDNLLEIRWGEKRIEGEELREKLIVRDPVKIVGKRGIIYEKKSRAIDISENLIEPILFFNGYSHLVVTPFEATMIPSIGTREFADKVLEDLAETEIPAFVIGEKLLAGEYKDSYAVIDLAKIQNPEYQQKHVLPAVARLALHPIDFKGDPYLLRLKNIEHTNSEDENLTQGNVVYQKPTQDEKEFIETYGAGLFMDFFMPRYRRKEDKKLLYFYPRSMQYELPVKGEFTQRELMGVIFQGRAGNFMERFNYYSRILPLLTATGKILASQIGEKTLKNNEYLLLMAIEFIEGHKENL